MTVEMRMPGGKTVDTKINIAAEQTTSVTLVPPLQGPPEEVIFDPNVELLAKFEQRRE